MKTRPLATLVRSHKTHLSIIGSLALLTAGLGGSTRAADETNAVAPALGLYVSPKGDDRNDGRTAGGAFASIARARDEVRKLKTAGGLPKGGVAIEILGGKYELQDSLEFSAEDSGTEGSPVIYRAFENQPVELLGGRMLKTTDLKPVADQNMVKRLDPSARGKVVCASVTKLGLTHAGPFPEVFDDSGGIFELFWNGRRLPLSRWPNEGYTTMKTALVNGDQKTPGVFEYRDDRAARWVGNPNVWLKGQWRVAWEDPAIHVAKIDTAAHTITFAAGITAGIGNKYTRPAGNGKEVWYALNLPEEIDRPGEWAIDFATQTLYLWPPDGGGELTVSQLDKPMISVNGATHLKFICLTLECSLGSGIEMKNAESDLVAGCTLRNLAKTGVIMDGVRSGVLSCDMYDLGAGCVLISGGDLKQLVPSQNFVLNNHLHDYGKLKAMYSAAVDVGFGGASNAKNHKVAVGVRVANNLIHDAPRDAVLVSGQDNLFELNEIYRCGFGSGDVGAFYSWLDWTIRGVVIRYNFVHDTVGGVNPDDGASGNTVFGNIFAGSRTGVWIASGPDHTTTNNIFIKSEGPVFGMDDRGLSRKYATNNKLLNGVRDINPQQPPWAVRFPEMVTLLDSHPELPLRTKFTRNVIVIQKGEPFALKMKPENQQNPALFTASDNFVTATDPGFVDLANRNLALKPQSEVFKKIPGFEPIPFEKIGLFKDEYRRVMPGEDVTRRPKGNLMIESQEEKNFGT
jgi:hypothetical protein